MLHTWRGTAARPCVMAGLLLAIGCKSSERLNADAGAMPSATGDAATDAGSNDDVHAGEALYWMPVEGGNSYACATCHALREPAEDGILHPAHAIGDATQRPHFKSGQLDELLDAVNSCLTEWMRVQQPWSPSARSWRELRAFLAAQNDGAPADPLSYGIASPSTMDADWEGGDADAGQQLFNTSCAACHGMDARGTLRGPTLAGATLRPAYVARRVRTSGPQNSSVYSGLTGGGMPFWSEDRLSDDQLRDLVAFLVDLEPPANGSRVAGGAGSSGSSAGDGGAGGEEANSSSGSGGMSATSGAGGASSASGSGGDESGGRGGAASNGGVPGSSGAGNDAGRAGAAPVVPPCASTHDRVGQVAQLSTRFHMVSGTATIVDDCTIRLSMFTFDGGGIDVRVYAGLGGNYDSGFAISDDLFGRPRIDETLTLRLPAGKTLDDLDGISVWCVAVGVDFGSGTFVAP